MARRPAAVLWDMDGTLVDTEPYWIAVETELVESYGHEWPEHHAHAVVGFDLLDSGAYIRDHGHVPLTPEEIVDRLLDGVIERIRVHIPWRPGARELLADLGDAGVPCALVTMSWRRFVEPILDALPPGAFQAVVTGDAVTNGKPHPEPYLRAADAVGAHPDTCVAIEDSPTGVASAAAAGCHVLAVPNVLSVEPRNGVRLIDSLVGVTVDDLGEPWAREGDHGADAAVATPAPAARKRTPLLLGGLAAVTALAIGAAVMLDRGGEAALPPGAVRVDAWAPYWTLGDTLPEADSRFPMLRELSPFWFAAKGVGEIAADPNVSAELSERFLAAADDEGVDVVPSILDETPAGTMARILADPATREAHVAAIVDFAEQGDYSGIDLDYEQFAFSDGRDTWAATSPNWVTFVEELATALHDDDRTLTVSIPPVYDADVVADRGFWVYDHGAIAEHVDAIRIMAYDFSVAEAGPIAPLGWVQQAVDGTTKAVPEEFHDKLVLGVPSYGANWVVSTSGECPASAEGRTGVTARSVTDLLARRGGTPQLDPVTGEWSFTYDLEVTDGVATCVQSRKVHWVDAEGVASRVEIARRAGWGGVALFALGYEDEQVWQQLITTAARPLVAAPAE